MTPPFSSVVRTLPVAALMALFVAACGGGGDAGGAGGGDSAAPGSGQPTPEIPGIGDPVTPIVPPTELDRTLRASIEFKGLNRSPLVGRVLPAVRDPVVQLGKALFFSKALSGELDTACASCHHPMLGGGDALSLPVGNRATNPDVLGPGRTHASGLPQIGRNTISILNVALKDTGLFWDGRIESLAPTPLPNGAGAPIRTPDTTFGIADPAAGPNLTAAQARFPVAKTHEMRGPDFERGATNAAVRNHLAARLGNYGVGAGELARNEWLAAFQAAFISTAPAESLITFDNIASALGEYQRSLVFVRSPWQSYVAGDNGAIDESAKRGALTFLATPVQGGGGCTLCHIGPQFTDHRDHTTVVPQFGPGTGDGRDGTQDFGRMRESGADNDRFRFRTPGLLNVEMTGPWMHNGAYTTLADAVRHYSNTEVAAMTYAQAAKWCELPQFASRADCAGLFVSATTNTQAVVDQLAVLRGVQDSLLPKIQLSDAQIGDIVAFLRSLTDPCLKDRACLAPWLPDRAAGGPDGLQLDAVLANGDPL